MNRKKLNSLLFIFVSTIISILVLLLIFFVLMLAASFLPVDHTSSIVPLLLFILSSVFAYMIYQKVTRFLIIRFNLADKLEPLRKGRWE